MARFFEGLETSELDRLHARATLSEIELNHEIGTKQAKANELVALLNAAVIRLEELRVEREEKCRGIKRPWLGLLTKEYIRCGVAPREKKPIRVIMSDPTVARAVEELLKYYREEYGWDDESARLMAGLPVN